MHAVITGAAGLLGRHLTSRLVAQGWSVTAVVRETSRRNLIELPSVKVHVCDLSRDELDAGVFRNADVMFHAAAAVTDWAPWSYFVANTIEATRRVCRGMIAGGCRRLVHISTVGVYGRPRPTEPLREDCPYASIGRWDYYTNSKIQAEQIVWGHQHDRSLDVTVIRPAMLYGPGDRGLIGRVIPLCQQRKLALVGNPQTLLPLVNVQDVVDALVRTAMSSSAIGEAFNVVNPEPVTQIDFFNTLAALVGASPVRRCVPYRLVYAAGLAAEIIAHVRKSERPPMITRYRVSLFGHPRIYSTDKIQSKLGWEPKISFREGIQQAVRWYLTQEHGSR
jgi:nucleoside-diphosphate-sugar epimerase